MSWFFSSELEDTFSQGRGDPKSRILLELIQNRADLRDHSACPGFEQNAEHANRAKTQLTGIFMAAPLIHKDGISANLQGDRD